MEDNPAHRTTPVHLRPWVRWGIYVTFVGMSLAYNLIIPPGYGPDEPRHERYYQYILETGQLPRDEATTGAIVHHPPLYYLFCVPVYAALRPLGAAYTYPMRLFSAGLGIIAIIATYRTLLLLFDGRQSVALAGAASVAVWPHYQLISAVISNDMLASVWGALTLYMAVSIALRGATLRRCALAGAFLGLGCYTKSSVLALGVVCVPALIAGGLRPSESTEGQVGLSRGRLDGDTLFKGAFAAGVAWLAAGGWWTISFVLTYGRLDVDPPWPLYTWPNPAVGARFVRGVWGLFRSSWIQVDWLPPSTRLPVYVALAAMATLSAVGLVSLVVRRARDGQPRKALALLIPVLGALALYLALLHNSVFINPGRFEGGRYWLPAVSGYAGLWLPLMSGILGKRWWWAALAGLLVLVVCNGLSYYWMISYLNPTYGPK